MINLQGATSCRRVLGVSDEDAHDSVSVEGRDAAALGADYLRGAVEVALVDLGGEMSFVGLYELRRFSQVSVENGGGELLTATLPRREIVRLWHYAPVACGPVLRENSDDVVREIVGESHLWCSGQGVESNMMKC